MRKVCLIAVVTLLLARQAGAQFLNLDQDLYEFHWFSPGDWSGSVEYLTGFSGDVSNSNGVSTQFKQHNNAYQLSLQNTGFSIMTPAWVTGAFGLTLGMGDNVSDGMGSQSRVDTSSVGYSLHLDFLNETPYGGSMFANKANSYTTQAFGRQETHTAYRGVSMRLNEGSPLKDMGLPYLSANLRLEQQELDQLNTSALNDSVYQFTESRRSLVHDGHKGGVYSDLNWRYEVNDVHLALNPDGDNRNKSAGLDFSMDFGEQLNRRWESHINFSDRTGANALYDVSTRAISESLQFNHFSNLSSAMSYQRTEVITNLDDSVNQSIDLHLQYQPYRNLSTSASVQRQLASASVVDSASLGAGYQYQHELPWEGRLQFSSSGSYGLTRSTNTGVTSGQGFEQNPFIFDPLALLQEVTLAQRFVDTATIKVYALKANAPLLPQALVACPGTTLPVGDPTCDYVVQVPMANRTTLRINPFSTTFLGPASAVDTLMLTYTYNVPPTQTYDSLSSSSTLTLDYRWIVFSLSHAQSRMALRGQGDSSFLQSSRSDRAQVQVNESWRGIQLAGGAGYGVSSDSLLTSRQTQAFGSASYRFSPETVMTLNTNWMRSKYQNPDRTSSTFSLRSSLSWRPTYDLTTTANVAMYKSSDSDQDSETVNEVNLNAQLHYGKIRLASSLGLNSRVRGSSELRSWRIDLSLVRDL